MRDTGKEGLFLVKIPAHNKKIFVNRETSFAEVLRAAGEDIETPCGGHGLCGGCIIRVREGIPESTEADRSHIPETMLKQGYRLACRPRKLEAPVLLEIPSRTKKVDLRSIPQEVRGRFGLGIDLGTTTIAIALVNIDTGIEAGVLTSPNPQSDYGADVISRAGAVMENPAVLKLLRRKTIESMDACFLKLMHECRVLPDDIIKVSIAGNSIMEHIIMGHSPVPLTVYPFSLVESFPEVSKATDFGFKSIKNSSVSVFPMAGANIGGDIISGLYYLELAKRGGTNLFIDIGTNVETALVKDGEIFALSSPAGPAFEGGEITFGMQAANGAIESVKVRDFAMEFRVKGGGTPRGICGSGLVKLVSELLSSGVIAGDGRIRDRDEIPSNLGLRVELKGRGNAFVLLKNARSSLYLTQGDVRQLQLAKSALRAGIEILLKKAGVKYGEVQSVFVAGAFGSALEEDAMVNTGMIPSEFIGKLVQVGDSALAGAKKSVISNNCEVELRQLVEKVKYLELSREKEFNDEFMRRMNFDR